MSRKPRSELVDTPLHITARCQDEIRILERETDGELWIAMLTRAVGRTGWKVHAYTLMPNHIHILLSTPARNLGDGMRWMQGVWAQTINRRRGRRGRVWADRFHSREVNGLDHYVRTFSYINRNPVEAGLVSEPSHWPWGSAAAISGTAPCPPFLTTNDFLDVIDPSPVRAVLRRRLATVAETTKLDTELADHSKGQSP
jgi:REP element-mobilizing transposase RayT